MRGSRFPSSGRRVLIAVALLLIAPPLMLMLIEIFEGERLSWTIPSIMFIGAFLLLWLAYRQSVELDDEVIIIRGYGSRKIPWSNVADIRVRSTMAGARQAQLLLKKGKTVDLPALRDPWPWRDSDFDNKFKQLHGWWTVRRI